MANYSNANLSQTLIMLYDAALGNNVTVLRDLLSQDPFLLSRPPPASCCKTTPLHIACKHGCLEFVVELLNRNQIFAEELDSNESSPLHIAAQNGHFQLIQHLVSAMPAMCFSRDKLGMTPAHVAATRGHLPVLEELLRLMPVAAKERVGMGAGGDTILHLCVKYDQLKALKRVVDRVGDEEMLNAKNGDGNTILHLAVANKQPEIVEELLKDKRLGKHILNANGWTAMDVLLQNLRGRKCDMKDAQENERDEKLTKLALQEAEVFPSKDITEDLETDLYMNWFESKRNGLMVAASLIATIAFQAGINPPSGVWQADTGPSNSKKIAVAHDVNGGSGATPPEPPLSAGMAVMARLSHDNYRDFMIVNTFCLVCAMSSMLLLILPAPPKRTMRILLFFVTSSMILSMIYMVFTYSIALYTMTYGDADSLTGAILLYLLPGVVTCFFVGIVFGFTSCKKGSYLRSRFQDCSIARLL